jgi:hypothetical protein
LKGERIGGHRRVPQLVQRSNSGSLAIFAGRELKIWDSDAETKVYWRSPDGNDPRTTTIPGKGIQTFQTAGEFKLEAVGESNREVNYGYVLLGLRK